MTYEKLVWQTAKDDYPVVTYSEIDDERWEVRKVEVFRNKPPGYADVNECRGSIGLSDVKMRESIAHRELTLTAITKEEFEEAWARAMAAQQGLLE
jgi:hypothetical protein